MSEVTTLQEHAEDIRRRRRVDIFTVHEHVDERPVVGEVGEDAELDLEVIGGVGSPSLRGR